MQSDREYKKDYEKTKTKYNIPLDMFDVVGAKKAQEIVSNTNYKNLLHHYTYLPDAMSVELTKNMMEIQSDVSENSCEQDFFWDASSKNYEDSGDLPELFFLIPNFLKQCFHFFIRTHTKQIIITGWKALVGSQLAH